MSYDDWPDIVNPKHIAARLGISDKSLRDQLAPVSDTVYDNAGGNTV